MALLLAVAMPSVVVSQQVTKGKKPKIPWVVPEKFKKVKNPIKADAASIAAGRIVFFKECLTCHGETGIGDGPQAKDLEIQVGNLRYDIANQVDGELYFKISKGNKPMPEFIKTLKPAQRWNVINFIRTLQATPSPWVAPKDFENKKNPIKADSSSIDRGSSLYASNCLSCHGTAGAGNGEEAKKQNLQLSDLGKTLGSHTDGGLFWKLTQDHPPAPKFGQSLDEEAWWSVVNFIRTFEGSTGKSGTSKAAGAGA